MARVLLVDDDERLMALLDRGFRYEGFEVVSASDGSGALTLAREARPDVVTLDIGLPGGDGLSVCRQMRRSTDVPVIMLTARGEVDDKVSSPTSPATSPPVK